MKRALALAAAVAAAAALARVHVVRAQSTRPAAPSVAPMRTPVHTRVGYTYAKMAGVIGGTRLRIESTSKSKIEAESKPVVRANSAWQLTVALVPPVDAKLTVKVKSDDDRTVQLDAKSLSAVVASGRSACMKCEVELAWLFQFAGGASGKTPLLIPNIAYTAQPAP